MNTANLRVVQRQEVNVSAVNQTELERSIRSLRRGRGAAMLGTGIAGICAAYLNVKGVGHDQFQTFNIFSATADALTLAGMAITYKLNNAVNSARELRMALRNARRGG
ncbi:MAG: hypothetical protein KGH72_03335 [Candidatus Micrarchaeota archaeon]|nr:hypothetical protein [Candidatus Micrarchaeota archaeon]